MRRPRSQRSRPPRTQPARAARPGFRLEFLGATGTVTGSRYLLTASGRRLLVDCGLFQGYKPLRLRNWERFPVDPSSIEAVVLTGDDQRGRRDGVDRLAEPIGVPEEPQQRPRRFEEPGVALVCALRGDTHIQFGIGALNITRQRRQRAAH